MYERLEGTFSLSDDDKDLQQKFHSLIQPNHVIFGTPAKVGRKFLRTSKDLIR